jgi:hypothetical protein
MRVGRRSTAAASTRDAAWQKVSGALRSSGIRETTVVGVLGMNGRIKPEPEGRAMMKPLWMWIDWVACSSAPTVARLGLSREGFDMATHLSDGRVSG